MIHDLKKVQQIKVPVDSTSHEYDTCVREIQEVLTNGIIDSCQICRSRITVYKLSHHLGSWNYLSSRTIRRPELRQECFFSASSAFQPFPIDYHANDGTGSMKACCWNSVCEPFHEVNCDR